MLFCGTGVWAMHRTVRARLLPTRCSPAAAAAPVAAAGIGAERGSELAGEAGLGGGEPTTTRPALAGHPATRTCCPGPQRQRPAAGTMVLHTLLHTSQGLGKQHKLCSLASPALQLRCGLAAQRGHAARAGKGAGDSCVPVFLADTLARCASRLGCPPAAWHSAASAAQLAPSPHSGSGIIGEGAGAGTPR